MPPGESSQAKTRLRGAMMSVCRATSRKKERHQDRERPPNTIAMSQTSGERPQQMQRSRRRSGSGRDLMASEDGPGPQHRPVGEGGGRMPRRQSPTQISQSILDPGRARGVSRRNLAGERSLRSSGSSRNVITDRDGDGAGRQRRRGSDKSDGMSYGYGFGDDDDESNRGGPTQRRSSGRHARQQRMMMQQEMAGAGAGGASVASSRVSHRQQQQQQQQQQFQHEERGGHRLTRTADQQEQLQDRHGKHRRTKTEEREYSQALRSRLDQVKQRRAHAQSEMPHGASRPCGRPTDRQSQRTAHDLAYRAEEQEQSRQAHARMNQSDSSLEYRGARTSGDRPRPRPRNRAGSHELRRGGSQEIQRAGSRTRAERSGSRSRGERKGSIDHAQCEQPSSRAVRMLRQPRRLSSGRNQLDDGDASQTTNQLAEARKAVQDVDRKRTELRRRIEELGQELKALDSLYDENVRYLKKLEDGTSSKEERDRPSSRNIAHGAKKKSSADSSPIKEKKSELGERKISWNDDLGKSGSSLTKDKPLQTKKAADMTPEQTKALNKAKMEATQTVFKNTSMEEADKRKKIQSVNKIAKDESLDFEAKISMLKDIADGKEPREARPAAMAAPPAAAATPASKKTADMSPEQTKALNKAKMMATQTVIKNTSMEEADKRKKIQSVNKIASNESLDFEAKISMLKDIADGKEPSAPAAKALPAAAAKPSKSAKPPSKKKAADMTPEQTKQVNKAKILAIQAVIKHSSMAEDDKRKKIQIVNSITGHEFLDVAEKVGMLKDIAAGKDVKDPNEDDDNDDEEGSFTLDDLDDNDSLDLGAATSFEVEGTIVPAEKVAYIRKVNESLHKSMHASMASFASTISRQEMWLSSFRRLDPRYKILSFFHDVAEHGVDKIVKCKDMENLRQMPACLQWFNRSSAFSVWRPTSQDAIRKMMSGEATGKGLEIKGKSAKCGCLSSLVPFIQIYEEQHKERIRECVRDKTMRVFFPTEKARDESADMLNDVVEMMMFFVQDAMQMLSNPDITEEQEKEVMKHLQWDGSDLGVVKLNDYAPQCYGVQISERLFWEGFVMMQDCSRPPGSKFETGRPSEPAFMDMNFKAVRHVPSEPGEPTPVVYQTDAEYPMSPRTLVVAYEETGRVLPVVSDFDCFTVGTRGVKFNQPLPPDQIDLVKWTVTNIESVLDQPFSKDTWTKRWLEILKQAAIKGFYPKMPRFGFGDPKSYSLMGKAVERLQDSGAVRHGAECFNYYFPQDLDEEFLVVSDTLPGGVPWKYVGVEELQEILLQKVDEGFTFPLNPKWVLCDPGWKRIYDKLMKSDKRHVQDSLKVWFPPESGIREHIERVYAKHPKGFVREIDESGEVDELDDMAAAELELERFMALEGAKKKIRAIIAMIALANTLPSAVAQDRLDKLQRGGLYRVPTAPDRQMRRDAAMHRAMKLQEAAAQREY